MTRKWIVENDRTWRNAEQCGYDRGYDEGYDEGHEEGYLEAMERAKMLLDKIRKEFI